MEECSPLFHRDLPEVCFDCGRGKYEKVWSAYEAFTFGPNRQRFVVNDLLLFRCDVCRDEILPLASVLKVEAARDEAAARASAPPADPPA